MGEMVLSKENQWGRKVKRLLNLHLVRGKEKPEFSVCISMLDWSESSFPLFPRLRPCVPMGPPLCPCYGPRNADEPEILMRRPLDPFLVPKIKPQ